MEVSQCCFKHRIYARLIICVALGSLAAFAQSTTIATVSSSYPMPSQTVGGNKYSISLSVSYPAGLAASSYISGTQLATDVQNSFSGYTPQSDPPEAILSSVLSSLLAKYPQMTAGTLVATIPPTVSSTGVLTLGATIEVIVGTYATGGITAAPQSAARQSSRIVLPRIKPAQEPGM